MRFKFLETEIYISFLFSAIICAMLAFDKTGLILPVIIAVALHEAGHLFTMWLTGSAPKEIRLIPASVQIISSMQRSREKEILVALSGPAVNLILFLSFYFNYVAFDNEQSLYYSLINLIIGLFNLLPVTGLDGGTILFNVLCRFLELNKAILVLRLVTFILAFITLTLGIYAAVNGKFNLSIFIIGLYFIVMNLIKM